METGVVKAWEGSGSGPGTNSSTKTTSSRTSGIKDGREAKHEKIRQLFAKTRNARVPLSNICNSSRRKFLGLPVCVRVCVCARPEAYVCVRVCVYARVPVHLDATQCTLPVL